MNPGAPTTTGEPLLAAAAHLGDVDGVLFDLDGVIYAGPEVVPGAHETLTRLAEAGIAYGFVTNNGSRSAADIAAQIRSYGLPAEADQVTTSAQVAARALAAEFPAAAPILAIGSPALADCLRDNGLNPIAADSAETPVAVVQGFHRELNWYDLAAACEAIRAGAAYWATNRDISMPTDRGPMPGNGSFVRIVETITEVTPTVTGKPSALMISSAAAAIGVRRPLMIGDRLDTDIAGGKAAGYPTALVLTGIHQVDDVEAAESGSRPDLILTRLPELFRPATDSQENP